MVRTMQVRNAAPVITSITSQSASSSSASSISTAAAASSPNLCGTTAAKPCTSNTPRLTLRSEEHTSELQSLMRISYAVFCLKKKKTNNISEQSAKHMTTPQTYDIHENNTTK